MHVYVWFVYVRLRCYGPLLFVVRLMLIRSYCCLFVALFWFVWFVSLRCSVFRLLLLLIRWFVRCSVVVVYSVFVRCSLSCLLFVHLLPFHYVDVLNCSVFVDCCCSYICIYSVLHLLPFVVIHCCLS
jgi:hypothetical protein